MMQAALAMAAGAFWSSVQPDLKVGVLVGPGLVFRRKPSGPWMLSCGFLDSVACLAWKLNASSDAAGEILEPSTSAATPWTLELISSLDDFEAAPVQWLPPVAFTLDLAPVMLALPSSSVAALPAPGMASSSSSSAAMPAPSRQIGLAARVTGVPVSIQEAMARRGFANIPKDILVEIMRSSGVDIDDHIDEYDLIVAAIKKFWEGVSELDLLLAAAKRFQHQERLTDDAFFEDEAVMSLFDEADLKEVQKTSAYLHKHEAYSTRCKKEAKQYAKKATKGVKKKGVKQTLKDIGPPPADTDRASALRYMPESLFKLGIYKDNKNGRWQAYHAISGSCSRSWTLHGEREALIATLSWIWKQAFLIEGTECPYKFLDLS